jgi:pimeloyl-ACP methyl ester carboxylesterase
VRIGAAVAQAGILDLRLAAALVPSAEPTHALLGSAEEHADVYALASPRERLPLGIPQLVLHGDRDDIVSIRIATSYAGAARAAGDACELLVLNGTGHFEHIDAASAAWHVARDWLAVYARAARN